MLDLKLLGTARLTREDGVEVHSVLAQPKRLALFAYLVLNGVDARIRRDDLLDLFWPELDPERARGALRKALHFLRRSLGAEVIRSHGDEELEVAVERVRTDVAAFGSAVAAGRFHEAATMYEGDLLDGIGVNDAPDFDLWLDRERDRLRRMAGKAYRTLAERRFEAGSDREAQKFAERAVALSSIDEGAMRIWMRAAVALGDRGRVLERFEALREELMTEFRAEPERETVLLVEEIRSGASVPPRPGDEAEIAMPMRRGAIPRGEVRGPGRPNPLMHWIGLTGSLATLLLLLWFLGGGADPSVPDDDGIDLRIELHPFEFLDANRIDPSDGKILLSELEVELQRLERVRLFPNTYTINDLRRTESLQGGPLPPPDATTVLIGGQILNETSGSVLWLRLVLYPSFEIVRTIPFDFESEASIQELRAVAGDMYRTVEPTLRELRDRPPSR